MLGHHSKCPNTVDHETNETKPMILLEHEIWNHGDVCYDPGRTVSCPDGCTSSKISKSDWLYCDMRWPRLTLYRETDDKTKEEKEKRYPCRVPEGKIVFYLLVINLYK